MNPSNIGAIRDRSPMPSRRNSTDEPTAIQILDSSIQQRRRRSGSWTGADESDEEINGTSVNGPYIAIDGTEDHFHPGYERELKIKLAFYFMDPIQKYKARRHIPWKLIIQFFKLLFVTVHLIIFGEYRYTHTNLYSDLSIGLRHMFLKGWDSVREVHAYPPGTGEFALYNRSEFFSYFDFAAHSFGNLEHLAVNDVKTVTDFSFCISQFNAKDLATIGFVQETQCYEISKETLKDNFSSETYLRNNSITIPWKTLTALQFNFSTNTETFRELGPIRGKSCFRFDVVILFNNMDHDGQIPISLHNNPLRETCEDPMRIHDYKTILIRALNAFVITMCSMSFVLCCRAILRAMLLKDEAQHFFKVRYNWGFTQAERMEFLNMWYIVICVNDVLIIVGSILKELIEGHYTVSDLWDQCAICLGVGTLLVWFGLLRYLSFFKAYNVLILTLKESLPSVLRFLMCGGCIYLGFVFCGWAILGPYHFKFKSIPSTSECLFSLINGDDMFATFSSVPDNSSIITVFSRIYLYVFISLFVYVVLSLFIAIIMEHYDDIKVSYRRGFAVERLHEFYLRENFDINSGIFRQTSQQQESWFRFSKLWNWISSRRSNRSVDEGEVNEATPLLT